MIRRPPRSTPSNSSAASDVYKRQALVRQGLLLIPLLLLLPLALGMDGVLWAGPISDGVAAVLVLVLGAREVRRLTAQQEETP